MISIIVPVYNEEEVIGAFIEAFMKKSKILYPYELIIVNDGSSDKTEEIVKKKSRKHKKIRLISYKPNKGLGYALRRGFSSSRGNVIVTMDSDLTHPPSFTGPLVKKVLEGYDVAIGSRYIPSAGVTKVPFHKDMLSKMTNLVTRLIIGSSIRDLTSGFRAYNSSSLNKITTQEKGFEVELEILLKLMKKNAKIIEVPFTSTDRQAGVSKFAVLKHGIRYFSGLVRIILHYW